MTEHEAAKVSPAARTLMGGIRAYQKVLSPIMGGNCRFHPSCSHYGFEAIQVHGAARGSWMAIKRIGRCHPFNEGGLDPVPPRVDGSTGRSSFGLFAVVAAIPIWDQLVDLLGEALNFFYQIIPNLGIAIILLTLVLSLLLFPLTWKQTKSMRAMQEIQPEVKRLQKELKGDREELNKQLMALYQERGVNPAAGCLPLLIQMPIWFALFRVLRATETYIHTAPGESINTSFLGMDLTARPSEAIPEAFSSGDILAAIPYIVMLIFIVAAGFYQQYQTTQMRNDDGEKTPQQQSMQTAMKIMPLFFGFITWSLTAGLGVYFATSSLFRIGQQWLIFRMDEESLGAVLRGRFRQAATEPDVPPQPEEPPPKGPSPHTSKKKKRRRRK